VSNKSVKPVRSGSLSPEYALLGFLISGPDYGYNLHQQIASELGWVWHLSQSQAYTILKRLENQGDLSTRVVAQAKHPDRQVLKITAQGRRRFLRWLNEETALNARAIRLEFLTRLYFSNRFTPKDTPAIITAQQGTISRNLERLERLSGELPADQTYNLLSLDLRLRQLKVIQEWITEIGARFNIHKDISE
jgi:DNA-binding PadR family transcriptional regulator